MNKMHIEIIFGLCEQCVCHMCVVLQNRWEFHIMGRERKGNDVADRPEESNAISNREAHLLLHAECHGTLSHRMIVITGDNQGTRGKMLPNCYWAVQSFLRGTSGACVKCK